MPKPPPGALAAAVAGVAVLAACIAWLALGLGADEEPGRAGRSGPTDLRERASAPPAGDRAGNAGAGRAVAALVRELALERKVAQLFLLGFRGRDATAPIFGRLRAHDLGGIVVDGHNYSDRDQLAALAGEAGVVAAAAGHLRPLVLAPQEGGAFNAFPDLPPRTTAAELGSIAQARDEASRAARERGALGIDGVLAPVADVSTPASLAVGPRAYSDLPGEVARYVRAVVGAYREQGLLAAAGRFPGLGSGSEDTRVAVAQVAADLDELRARDLVPFRAAIAAGVPAVVISNGLHVTDDFVVPGTMSRAIATDLLRGELRFGGIAITDDLADPGVTALSSTPAAAVEAVAAGADLLYVSGPEREQDAAYEAVLAAVRDGGLPLARVDEALTRVLAVKRGYGLLR